MSIKKSLLILLCGSLLVSAVPAKAEFSMKEWPVLGNAIVAAAFAGACYGVYKVGSWLFGSTKVSNFDQLEKIKSCEPRDTFVVTQNICVQINKNIKITGPQPNSVPAVIKAGTYKVISKGGSRENGVSNQDYLGIELVGDMDTFYWVWFIS